MNSLFHLQRTTRLGWSTRVRLRFSTDTSHSRFISEAASKEKWGKKGEDEMEGITATRGKILPTSSHLFKLVLPLPDIKNNHTPPTIFLLHPSQPLSHLSRLIAASISTTNPSISFQRQTNSGAYCQWSHSTDVGDFIRDAARAAEFNICISHNNTQSLSSPSSSHSAPQDLIISIAVPTFADRTRYLRRRLTYVTQRLDHMQQLKFKCDREAHRGARKMALVGFGMLVVYWGTVARLTFWDFGWDVMEPITYLSGLSTVVVGYLWFLYQGREVSYTSVLATSISARRDALYKARGFDMDKWTDFMSEKKLLKTHIANIARDYEQDEVPPDQDGIKLEDQSLPENVNDKGALEL